MDYERSSQDISQLQDHFKRYQELPEKLIAHWNKLKSNIEVAQERLTTYGTALSKISWRGEDEDNPVDYDGFNDRVRISLAGTIYEVKRGALVQDPAIGWNRLSCLFKKRWEKFLLCDKNGRIYFDYESEWMKPILQALKGEVDIVLDKSPNNVSAWNGILSRFQLHENIKLNVHYEASANRYFDEISWRRSKGDWKPMTLWPKPQGKKIEPSFHMTAPFRLFGESQLAVRLSGRWTEQADDVDEEGNIYYDVSSSAFRALLQYARFRSFRLKGAL
eukprot:gene10350-11259_t